MTSPAVLIVSRRAWKRTWPQAEPTSAAPSAAPQQRHDRARLELRVVVDEQDPLARRRLEPGRDAAREAGVAPLREHPRARGGDPGGAVVDHEQLGVERGQRGLERAQARVEQRPAVLRDDDRGDARHDRYAAATRSSDSASESRRALPAYQAAVEARSAGAGRAHAQDRRGEVLRRRRRRHEPVDPLLDQLRRRVVGIGDHDTLGVPAAHASTTTSP